ncbi:hypothetical protein BDR03DRAFT_940480 [Suillus americanus]|nr:hypothetical protein BDR03DRAFT_940480 [Suillus americanus]
MIVLSFHELRSPQLNMLVGSAACRVMCTFKLALLFVGKFFCQVRYFRTVCSSSLFFLLNALKSKGVSGPRETVGEPSLMGLMGVFS